MMPMHADSEDANINQDTNTQLWVPNKERAETSQLFSFKKHLEDTYTLDLPDYDSVWQWSIDNKEKFWSEIWDFCGVIGDKGTRILLDGDKMPGAQFFPDARLNFAENLLRRRDDETAIVFRGEDKVETAFSFKEVYDNVSRLSQAMQAMGVSQGDRVAGYMPNMPETIFACLAAASLGAIWSSASPDFGVQGVLDRFGQIEPTILFAAEGYYYAGKELDCLDKIKDITAQLPSLEKTVIVPYRRAGSDVAAPGIATIDNAVMLGDFIADYQPGDIAFNRLPFSHPLFIMFSSGTTGVPKCIVHGAGGTLIQHLKEHQLQTDIHPGDRMFYFTTCGWMMWNWLITGLASGATLLLFDGSPFHPTPHVLFDYADDHGMTLFGTSAKYIDALRKHGVKPKETHKLSTVKTMTSTGSPLTHEGFDYVYSDIKSDIHLASISGGTDIVSCFVLGNPLSPVYRGEIQGAGLGMDMDCWDEAGQPTAKGQGVKGELVCKSPFPCMPVMFWNDPDGERYHDAYFDRFDNIWCHGDWVERTEHGGWIIHGRSDATLNPGGVRIGTAEIYRQVEKLPEILESLAVGQEWDDDVRVVLFVVMRDGAELNEDLQKTIKTQIRSGASPRHVPAKIIAVTDIPRTKSGKITELAVRDLIHGREVKNVEALSNPEALEQYRDIPELQS